MGYQYGRAPYNGRRGGAHSTGEALVVIPVASHSVTATFREGAQQWFQKLGPGVITSWEPMKTLFLTQFQAAVKYIPPVTTLANVKQKEGESLTSYFKRFNAESTLVRGATDETLKILLIAGLRVGTDFWKHLQGKDPVSLADVLAQAESFKAIEQSLAETKKNDNTHNSKGRSKRRDRSLSPDYRRNARSPNKVNAVSSRREWSPPSNYERRVNNYTPLAASIDHIFEPPRAEDVEKTAEVKFQRAGSIRAIFGGHPFVGDSNRALEKNAREARHPPLTNIHNLEDRPPKVVHLPHNDALVITKLIGAMNVHRVFLDNGSSTNILYYSTYKKLGFPDSDMYFEDAHVYGFTGEAVRVMGSVRLPVMLGEGALSVTQMIDLKFPTPNRVGSLRGSQYESRDCYHKAVKEFRRRRYEGKCLPFEDVEDIHTKPSGEVHAHYFVESPGKEETNISGNSFLTRGRVSRIRSVEEVVVNHTEAIIQKEVNGEKLEGRSEILQDVKVEVEDPRDFDFDLDPRIPMPAEKTGPTEDTISIPVDKNDSSRVLKVGSQLDDEMRGSLARFLIANLDVLAWSHSDMIGINPEVMCHRLNIFPNCKGIRQKRRPVSGERAIALKEEVDRLLEVGLIKESFYPEWLANPDAYSSYNQIPMYGPDQEHTSFITERGLYYYIGMPFGLINAGATYRRLVNMMFKDQIGRTMEVYVDDMMVKSEVASDHIKHLMEMFNILRRFRMKLNSQKCVFGMESGKFLGFIVNHRGIEANPAKIKALMDMKSPTNVKQVQSLTGKIAALNRFVSKSSDRCKEFFKAIKLAGKDFEQLENPPMLSKPLDGESLILYLAVSEYSISAVLVREEDGQQSTVYYVSKRLHDAETRYTSMEKLVYALILASRKLRPYFQAHRIEVRTAYPLRQVLYKPESSGRMLKWAVELRQFDLEYAPQTAIKGQALADFLLEFDSEIDDKALVMLRVGIVLVSPEGHHLMSAIHFKFYATNNDAEYEALINGLKIALEMGVRNLIARSDSELVVNQVNGGFQARGPRTELYLRCTQRLIGMFKEVRLECVPWEKNSNADALAKMGSQQEAVLLGSIPLEIQEVPSIPEIDTMQVDEAPKETWMTPILAYIRKGILLEDKFKARRLRYQAARYVIYDEVLYKRGFNQPLLRCVEEEEGNYILREVHKGICGNHSGGSSLAMNVLRQGYYWPTMKEDAMNFVKACDRCQRFANYSSMPATLLTPMASPWPFAM
ncbi:uncharacterized protein LOC141674193 [Apium graveolens]|uniref:uncharacterized protein LOC141674193 n=1 Tax=Apium graveolens TaxID=4045 RepID=UPI003D7B295D